jgi:hypothetical protein
MGRRTCVIGTATACAFAILPAATMSSPHTAGMSETAHATVVVDPNNPNRASIFADTKAVKPLGEFVCASGIPELTTGDGQVTIAAGYLNSVLPNKAFCTDKGVNPVTVVNLLANLALPIDFTGFGGDSAQQGQ